MTRFVWIERVDEHARVDRVPEGFGSFRSSRAPRNTGGSGHLSSHRGEDLNAAHSSTETTFKATSGAHERVPGRCGFSSVGLLRAVVGWVERQNHSDGPAAVREDVGRPRVPYLTHDTRRMRLQFSNADDLSRRLRTGGAVDVVSHVTTLRAGAQSSRFPHALGYARPCLRTKLQKSRAISKTFAKL